MADNIYGGSINAALPVIATDDVNGVHFQRIKLDSGTDGVSQPVEAGANGGLPVSPVSSWEMEVVENTYPKYQSWNQFGINPDVDVGTEDVWGVGGTYVPPTSARVHAIASNAAADTALGNGARTLTVTGLNNLYAVVTETVSLSGVTPVNTANAYVFIQRIIVATVGTGGVNAGTITATAATDATISIQILPGKGASQLGVFMVPAAHTAYVFDWGGAIAGGANANVTLELFERPLGGSWRLRGAVLLAESGTSASSRIYKFPIAFAEKSLLKITATSDTNNMIVRAHMDLILES